MRRYHWSVLPKANSATLCRKFVAQAVQNVRDQFPQVHIIHYLDDISLAHKNEEVFSGTYGQLQQSLGHQG